jgi:ferredoxin
MPADSRARLRVNRTACVGHGVCAELLPEVVNLDEWDYPIIADIPLPPRRARDVRRAVTACPALALRLSSMGLTSHGAARRAYSEEAQIFSRDSSGRLRTC